MKRDVPKQNRIVLWILGVFVLILLSLLILLQSSNLWKSFTVESASDTLLLYGLSSLNVAAFVIFGFIFLRSIIRLMRERRALELGSKMKSRLLFYFALISILPIIAMAVFSYLFLNRALDRWFTQMPENVIREADKVSAKSKVDQFTHLQETANMLAISLEGRAVNSPDLDELAVAGNMAFLEVLSARGETVVAGKAELAGSIESEIAALAKRSYDDPILRDGNGLDAAIANFSDGRKLVVVRNFQVTGSVSQMVESSLTEIDRLKNEQFTVRQIGFLTLGVLTFLLIFASSWTAFYIARGLTVPLKALAEGAEMIAQGHLGHRVDVFAEDELALLVSTFNEMSAKLEENSAELTERRRYIETVLLSLPTGVISVDAENRVSTINPAAKMILRLEPGDFVGIEFERLIGETDRVVFERLIARAKRIGHASDQTKLTVEDGHVTGDIGLPVSLTATALPDGSGAVLVIEDLSELISAQRASAWQEVARRMAHEIKNPLTPIQLSAERIAKRFIKHEEEKRIAIASTAPSDVFLKDVSVAEHLDGPTSKVVQEGTDTILREVQSLKSMVDEFSRFARLPNVKLESGDVNEVVQQAADLYQDRTDDVRIDANLTELPAALIDEEQLKRVFVNLIDNAVEAPSDEAEKIVSITSRHDTARDLIIVEVSDNGTGIDAADYQKLFQPYFSTKGRGTGLGLAIVQRIITEHHGKIKAVPNQPFGARFIVELPVGA